MTGFLRAIPMLIGLASPSLAAAEEAPKAQDCNSEYQSCQRWSDRFREIRETNPEPRRARDDVPTCETRVVGCEEAVRVARRSPTRETLDWATGVCVEAGLACRAPELDALRARVVRALHELDGLRGSMTDQIDGTRGAGGLGPATDQVSELVRADQSEVVNADLLDGYRLEDYLTPPLDGDPAPAVNEGPPTTPGTVPSAGDRGRPNVTPETFVDILQGDLGALQDLARARPYTSSGTPATLTDLDLATDIALELAMFVVPTGRVVRAAVKVVPAVRKAVFQSLVVTNVAVSTGQKVTGAARPVPQVLQYVGDRRLADGMHRAGALLESKRGWTSKALSSDDLLQLRRVPK